jgi:hypothetical protein
MGWIGQMEAELSAIKERKKQTSHHITWEELPEQDRFRKPMLGRKRLVDAVRMIAYRAETAMCAPLRPRGMENTAARRLLQDLFVPEADIHPEADAGQLHIKSIADHGQRWIEHWRAFLNNSTRWRSFSREPT